MSGSHDPDARIREWLRPGPTEAPDDLVEAMLAEVPAIRQRNRWELGLAPVAGARMRTLLAAAMVVVLVAGLLLIGALLAGSRPHVSPFAAVPDVSAFGAGAVSDVVAWEGTLVAVGGEPEAGHTVGAAWTSTDGVAWQPIPGAVGTADLTIGRVATDGRGLVAIGYACSPGPGYCGQPSLLRSDDARTWQAATIVGGSDMSLTAVARGASGFVAVGSIGTTDRFVGAIAATSNDGIAWSVPAADSPPFAGSMMAGVTTGPEGLVAVGHGPAGPSTWHSADGFTWVLSALPDPAGDATVADVASAGDRYVAVGRFGERAGAWVSIDGTSWTIQPASPSLDSASMRRITWTGREYLAFGASAAGNGLAWSSMDGSSWTRLDTGELFTGASISAGARIGSLLVLFGSSASGDPIVADARG